MMYYIYFIIYFQIILTEIISLYKYLFSALNKKTTQTAHFIHRKIAKMYSHEFQLPVIVYRKR